MFIAFEGLDGSGSTTQVALLSQYFQNQHREVVATKEPTTGKIGRLIRDSLQHKYNLSPLALQLLFAADRDEHLTNLIKPSLTQGKIVISDRYLFSSIAFGSLGVDVNFLEHLYQDFLRPDLVILLKLSPAECMHRIAHRGQATELFEQEDKLTRIWTEYDKLAQKYDFIKIIDASLSKEEIHQQVVKIIQNHFSFR